MLSSITSRLNSTVCSSIQKSNPHNLTNLLAGQGKSLTHKQRISSSIPYSLVLLTNTYPYTKQHTLKQNSMATATSKAVFGDVHVDDFITRCGNAVDLAKPFSVFFNDRSQSSFQKARVSLKWKTLSKTRLASGSSFLPATRGSHNLNLLGVVNNASYACYSTGAASDVSLDGNSEEQLASSTILSSQAILGESTLKLLSGSCYLPHPDKEATGGEDAHFICTEKQAIGVADGVGGWADVGVNAGLFARELMSFSIGEIEKESMGCIDPAKVLEKAHSNTKAKGSSTACIIALSEKGLHAINLGDSGFIVIRDGNIVFRSPVQQHGFNFTFQLESGNDGDLPSSGQVFMIPVIPGDVVIAGTDGLFDNLYNKEITPVVEEALSSGLEPQATAQKIAALARKSALDRTRRTPFSTAAQEAGFRYIGGKLDDITVVVSYVTSRDC